MDCSLREASRKEQSIAPKNFFWTHQDHKRAKIPYIRVILVFQKRLEFCKPKNCSFGVFRGPIFGALSVVLYPAT